MQTLSSPDVAAFIARLLKRTRKGRIDWKERSHNAVQADIGQGYEIVLTLVPDFDGSSPEPDHLITLSLHGEHVFDVDRRDLSTDELAASLGEELTHSYGVFDELWRRALSKSNKISGHLEKVNAILDEDDDPF
jgi:hypothetical protein